MKIHVLLDHDDYMPRYVVVTEARKHDRGVASQFAFPNGFIVAFGRAYNDFGLFNQMTEDLVRNPG